MLTRVRGGCVVHRCQNKNAWSKGWPVDVNDVMHRKHTGGGFWGFWKSQLVELSSASGEDGWLSRACSGLVAGATRVGGGGEKVSIERLCLSPYAETFNSKVIKGFVPELRSRYVFFVFRDSYVLCIYVMNILCTFHEAISWLCYTMTRRLIYSFLYQHFLFLFLFLFFFKNRAIHNVYLYYIYCRML